MIYNVLIDEQEKASTVADTEPPPEEEKTPRGVETDQEGKEEGGTDQDAGDQTETADDEEEDGGKTDEEGTPELCGCSPSSPSCTVVET